MVVSEYRGVNRRRYVALAGMAATSGCLRLQEQSTASGDSSDLSQGSGATTEVSGRWPQYGYDTANTGSTTDEAGPKETATKQWHATDNQPNGLGSSPAVAGGRVYIVTNGGPETERVVWAIDATTGETVWEQPVSGVWKQSPAVVDDQVFVGTDDEEVVALDSETGAYNWRAPLDGQVSSQNELTVTTDVVFVTDESGRLYSLSTDDGSELGRVEFDQRCLSAPATANGRVFVTTYGPSDLDAYPEGTEPWVFFSGDQDDETARSLIEMDGSGTVHMISPEDRTVQWSTSLPDFVVASPTVVGGTVYAGCWDGYLYALDAATGDRAWRYELGTPISGSASVADGTVYVGGWDSVLHAISTDGTREWILPPDEEGRITTKPAVVDGVVYANGNDSIIAVDTDGRRLWQFRGSMGWFDNSSPAVADGSLFVCGLVDTRPIDGEEVNVGGLFKLV